MINVITRQDFQGAEVIANYGRAFELVNNPSAEALNDPQLLGSDGDSKRLSFVFGGDGEKSRFVIGLEYNEQDPVYQGNVDSPQFQRTLTIIDLDDYLAGGLGSTNRDLDGDGRVGLRSVGSSRNLGGYFVTSQGILTRDLQTGEIRTLDDSGDDATGGDLYNFAPVNFLQTPYERTGLFVQGDYDLGENLKAYVEARYSNRRSSQLLAPLPYDSRFDPGAVLANGRTGVSADNVYNPFGEDLTDVRRRIAETGGRGFEQELNQIQINTGLRGNLGEWAPGWQWDVSWQWGRQARVDTDNGQFVGARLANALGPSFFDSAGVARCGTPDQVIAACVPLNLFGGVGSITQDQLDYVSASLNDRLTTKRQVFNANVTGDLFTLPAGPLATAFGYEYRKEESAFIPDSSKSVGAVTGTTTGPTVGEYDIDSLFTELNIPLLSQIPGVELLELGAGFRYDDYSSIGDTGNLQASLRWQPISGLLIRGSYAEVFREPNVGELFASVADNFPSYQDVCSTGVVGDPNAPDLYASLSPEQQARCAQTGVPLGGYRQSDAQPRSRVAGNPDLGPEAGETYTLGFAWSPEFLSGFSITADYWDIDLKSAVATIAASSVVNRCIINGDPASCAATQRFDNGDIDFVSTPTENIGGESAHGFDVALNYSHHSPWGLFDARFLVTYLAERESTIFADTPAGVVPISVDAAGRFEQRNGLPRGVYPHWKANLNLDWSYGDWGASLNLDYIGGVDEFDLDALDTLGPNDPVSDALIQRVDAEIYVDLVTRYQFAWGTRVSLGINNLFNNQPPFINGEFNANTDTDTYRLLGRSWFAELRHNF